MNASVQTAGSAAGAAPPQPAAAVVAVQAPGQQAGPTLSQTPRRLRLLTLGVVLAGVLFGLVGGTTFALQASALSRAEENATQLIRVQQIQTNLLSADATATNAFLVGGLEPAAQRESYDRLIADTSRLIADAAQAQPADAQALAELNTEVVAYATTIELARANNRQGFPVGAQYLRTASAGLRATALPLLDNLVQANTQRAAEEMNSRPAIWFEVVGALILVGFVLGLVWLGRTFKRTLNVGVLAASLALLLAVVAGAIALAQVDKAIDTLKTGTFTRLTSAAQARIGANNAKANESLTLISRGSGSAYENAWKASATKVSDSLKVVGQGELITLWQGYLDAHTDIRAKDDAGQWDQAVKRATGTADDSSNTLFAAFDDAASSLLNQQAQAITDEVQAPRIGLVVAAIIAFAAGVAAALLGRWGVAARLKEYR